MTCTKLLLVLTVSILTAMVSSSAKEGNQGTGKTIKHICITFDELPASRTFGDVDRGAINYLLLDALKRHGVKTIGFVLGEHAEVYADILGDWLNAGHKLGNQTYTGQDYNQVGPEQFIRDIKQGANALDPMLSGFGQKKRYFRFPYLHYGSTVEARRAVTTYLEDHKYIVCPATVIPEDYLYNLTLQKLGRIPDSAKYEQLMNDYINHVLDELERVERLAKELEGRPVTHILQLRTNRLNAVFLDDLFYALEDMGYSFVSIDTALKDKVYVIPEAYYGLKGLGYLDMIVESDPDLIPAE